MVTILSEQQDFTAQARRPQPGLWLDPADLERVTGITLKPQGLCKDDICVPAPRGADSFVDGDGHIDIEQFWRYIGHPVVHDEAGRTWALGTGAGTRQQAMDTLVAPEFLLPDVDGQMHALSDFRGQKVFLATWASW